MKVFVCVYDSDSPDPDPVPDAVRFLYKNFEKIYRYTNVFEHKVSEQDTQISSLALPRDLKVINFLIFHFRGRLLTGLDPDRVRIPNPNSNPPTLLNPYPKHFFFTDPDP